MKIIALIFLLLLLGLGLNNVMAQEQKRYFPVDIVYHVDLHNVKTKYLDTVWATEKINQRGQLTDSFYEKIKDQRDKWLKDNGINYQKKFEQNKVFNFDKENDISIIIKEFSKS